ncbi:MAG: PKD domain-containing protein, partial [Flavobacteriales bacterium]|nr:PKD domain-containing protein [Flavobacteriales bacterium]
EQGKYVLNTAFGTRDSLSHFVNGNLLGKGPIGNIPGLLNIGYFGGDLFKGNIAEIVMVDGSVNETDRNRADQYLMDKYAPPINLGADRRVCSYPDSIDLDSSDYMVAYNWSSGDTTASIKVDSSGIYILETTDIFGRLSSDSIFFILDTFNNKIDFGFDTVNLCLGEEFTIKSGSTQFDYLWNTGDTTSLITVDSTATYKLSISNCIGGVSEDSVFVGFNSPNFTLGKDTTGCFNKPVDLISQNTLSNVSYLWSGGEITPLITVDTSELYSLQLTDQFGCQYSDTIFVTIDSSLLNLTLGNDTILCEGNLLSIINPVPGISSYAWNTGNFMEYQVIDTAGTYSVRVGNQFCEVSDTITVSLKGKAPTAIFVPQNLCFGDTVEFIDNSIVPSGDTLKQWRWLFGDGTSDTLESVYHEYGNDQSYVVNLEITTNRGCSDTINKTISIEPLPLANFGFQAIAACSKSPLLHIDSSTVKRGSIISYNWNFGDPNSVQNTSNLRNVNHTYDTFDSYIVSLAVETDRGCKDTIQKIKYINPSPNVDYVFNGTCLSDSTRFTDLTTLSSGTLLDYKWNFLTNFNQESRKQNPVVQFDTAGKFSVVLRVRSDLGAGRYCVGTKRDSIDLFASPVANYSVGTICEENPFQVTNLSTSVDSILKYRFILDQRDTFEIANPVINIDSLGSYELELFVETENACVDNVTQFIFVNPNPEVAFSILNNNTGIPFGLALENTTIGAAEYLWTFGTGDSSSNILPTYIYQDTGHYQLQLKAISDKGCIDSLSQEVLALSNFLDATLSKIFFTENGLGDIKVSAQIINSGFNTIEQLEMVVDLNNEFEFREIYDKVIYKGKAAGYEFKSSFIPQAGRKIDFVCVRILTVNGGKDSILTNNELCEKGFNNEITISVYPNPVESYLNIEFVLPNNGNLQLKFYDQLGREVLKGFDREYEEGYYKSLYNVIPLNPGIYHYRFVFGGVERTGVFIKR